MAKKETTLTVADMKKAIWEREPKATCHSVFRDDQHGYEVWWWHSHNDGPAKVVPEWAQSSDEAWRNAYDALFGGKK